MKTTMLVWMASVLASAMVLGANPVTISNTEPRRDTQGDILDAHDGCLEYFEGQFYLYGTRYDRTDGFGKANRYVCYSSPDLTTWTAHGEMLKDAPSRTYYRLYGVITVNVWMEERPLPSCSNSEMRCWAAPALS